MELKFLDCAWNAVTVNGSTDGANGEMQPSSGVTSCISVPAQGDGESERDGRKYTIKSVWVSGIVETATTGDTADALVNGGTWFALVLDTQANGATIVSENVFINPSTLANGMMPQPLRNLQNSKRYRILTSQYIPPSIMYGFNDTATTGSVAPCGEEKVNLSWRGNIVCDSTGTTANVSSASDNAIHLIAYASGGIGKAFAGKSRVRFVG